MNFVRVVRRGSAPRLEEEINNILAENIKSKLIDIKYSSNVNGSVANYTAIIIFERQ